MQGSSIQAVELYKLFVPLKEPFVISLGAIYNVQNLVVIIRTADGCAGYGECSPYMTINGESVDTCFIVGQYFAKVLQGKNALDIAGCIEAMDKTIYANSSIKSAFDIALHDIAAQHAGVPLYKFLGGEKRVSSSGSKLREYKKSEGEKGRLIHALFLLHSFNS